MRLPAFTLLASLLLTTPAVRCAPEAAKPPASGLAEFRRLVQPRPCDLAPQVRSTAVEGGLVREKVVIQSEPGQRVALLILRPRDEPPRKRPAVLILHGTRGSKEGMEGWLQDLAARGFVAVAPDARWHGELAQGDYEDAIIRSYRTGKGHPWLYETVTDTLRVLDYLQTRADVSADGMGMIGISMGGMNTWLAAAIDPRVKVAVPCIGVTSFGYQLRTGRFTPRTDTLPRFHRAVAQDLGEPEVNERVTRAAWDRVLPGITGRFDCPRMLEAIAPRALLILNGEKDDRCPLEGVQICYDAAKKAYEREGAAERLRMIIAPDTGHSVTPSQREAALEWCVRWLKP